MKRFCIFMLILVLLLTGCSNVLTYETDDHGDFDKNFTINHLPNHYFMEVSMTYYEDGQAISSQVIQVQDGYESSVAIPITWPKDYAKVSLNDQESDLYSYCHDREDLDALTAFTFDIPRTMNYPIWQANETRLRLNEDNALMGKLYFEGEVPKGSLKDKLAKAKYASLILMTVYEKQAP